MHRRRPRRCGPRRAPLERHEVGDHRDCFGGLLVGVRPAHELVEVVADARELARAFALDGPCRRGPGPRPRHRLPQQRGRRHACRRLVLPGGMLRRRDTGGDHHGAAVSHGRTGDGVWGGGAPRRTLPRGAAREAGGSKGGAASPCQTAVFNTAWAGLRTLKGVRQPPAPGILGRRNLHTRTRRSPIPAVSTP